MALFSRGDPTARGRAEGERILRQAGEREQRAARAMAARAGYDVAGAEHVAYEAPRSKRCLVVRADRVDLYDEDPEAHRRLWRRDLAGVRLDEGDGLLARVEVVGPDDTLSVELPRTQARLLHRLLTDGAPPPVPSAPPEPTDRPLDVLRQLTAMREEGLITEVEFAAKKAEILDRM